MILSRRAELLAGGLNSCLGPSPICPRHPGEGWEPSGGGFAPLHRLFSRPAFFVAGPRVTEVSLSGSTRRFGIHFSRSAGFGLVPPVWGRPLLRSEERRVG